MAGKHIHVRFRKGAKWAVTRDGQRLSTHGDRDAAIKAGHRAARARDVDVVIHGRDGKTTAMEFKVFRDSIAPPLSVEQLRRKYGASQAELADAERYVFRAFAPSSASGSRLGRAEVRRKGGKSRNPSGPRRRAK